MVETPAPNGDRHAKDLAQELLSYLEAVANLHYLLDRHVVDPDRLTKLRAMEDEIFNAMLKRVLSHLD